MYTSPTIKREIVSMGEFFLSGCSGGPVGGAGSWQEIVQTINSDGFRTLMSADAMSEAGSSNFAS